MSMFTTQIAIIFVFLLLTSVQLKDCVTKRKQCNEHKDCCGGCCVKGECISCNERTFYIHDYMKSYEKCIYVKQPCREQRSPPGMECMYEPVPECIGCEPVCRTMRKYLT